MHPGIGWQGRGMPLSAGEDRAGEGAVVATVRGALPGIDVIGPPIRIPKGFSSESWRVATDAGELVVKIRRHPTDAAKLWSQAEAVRLARARGVPTAEVLHVGVSPAMGGRPVVILRFTPGVDAEEALPRLERSQRASLFSDLGDVVGRLHRISLPHFTERIGTPEAAVDEWSTVVRRTAERAASWNREIGALTASEVAAIHAGLVQVATDISAAVSPALTHRDLYPTNVLVGDGHVTALIDFELAKGYDPLLDFVKLGMFVFERWPEGFDPFIAAYRRRVGRVARVKERLIVCLALEHLVMVPNWVNFGEERLVKDSRDVLQNWLARSYPWWVHSVGTALG